MGVQERSLHGVIAVSAFVINDRLHRMRPQRTCGFGYRLEGKMASGTAGGRINAMKNPKPSTRIIRPKTMRLLAMYGLLAVRPTPTIIRSGVWGYCLSSQTFHRMGAANGTTPFTWLR
jgi:hypothetical protein